MIRTIRVCLALGAGMFVWVPSLLAFSPDTGTVARLEKEGHYKEILALCEKADESATTLCIQGDYYYHGRKDVPRDKSRGQERYRRALGLLLPDAEAGDATAQYQLARCYEYGQEDMKEARTWYLKATDAGNSKAMFKTAWFAARRIGAKGMEIKEARELALRYAKAASDAGNPDGTALLAWLTYIDCGAGRDFEKAVPLIMESVKENSSLGKTLLGRMYMEGRCVEQNMEKAEHLLQEAVDQGYSEALGTFEEIKKESLKGEADRGFGEIPEQFEKVPEIWTPETKAKYGAKLYERQETREKGIAFLQEAAKEGSPCAMARLSALFYLGEGGVRQDFGMALKLMKAAVSKGFPADELPMDEVQIAFDRAQAQAEDQKNPGTPLRTGKEAAISSVRPGYGFPGRLAAYDVTPQLKKHLDRFNLSAGWFYREPIDLKTLKDWQAKELLANELPYLLFTPKRGQKPVPVVIYFGGTGEHGTNLVAQFNQTTIFSKITSPEFQKKHPCYLFAPMVPKDSVLRCLKAQGTPMSDLVCDALYAVIREANNPPVDTNRVYLTGLSFGGSAAYTFPFGYPGRFAASLPVAGFTNAHPVPEEHPGNFWLLYNEHEYASEEMQRVLEEVTRAVTERGGEHRSSSFPDKGHNAWDKAWREDAVWDWVFSKTADGKPVAQSTGPAKPVAPQKRFGLFLDDAICTAAKPGRDAGTGPERAADGLEATCYVSAEPVTRGDWWQIEFATPVSGRITVKSGYRDGKSRVKSARVETSSDGTSWTPCGRFLRASGECRFDSRDAVKYLRVVSESQTGEQLVLREVEISN